ncbi:LysM peptidoglycan-binding domain-containing protein [Arthrobacter sp. NPDC092385]|uniref:LysM peptidoglycan-binding domain-containing protein n=1 Tax=Arthrobacter sp. NPDC092385 TaxID=3363943 RepID=UPI0038309CE5
MKSSDAVQAGLVLACALVVVAAGQALDRLHRPAGPRDLESVLGFLLSVLGGAVIGLWILALAVAVLAELLQRRGLSAAASVAQRCTPAVMRRLAAALLGVHLLAVPAMAQAAPHGAEAAGPTAVVAPGASMATGLPASADTDGASTSHSPYWSPVGTPSGTGQEEEPASAPALQGPQGSADRQNPPGSPGRSPSPAWRPTQIPVDGGLLFRAESRPSVGTAEVVVAPGDSLWSIVALQLGPLATAADIAEAWPAWYDTNRSTIGEDPSHLVPGQVLKAP